MEKFQTKERLLAIAAGFLSLSVILMTIIIPGVYSKSLPNETNIGAIIGISLVIIFRILIIMWFISIIKKIRRDGEKRKTGYIIIGILLIIFGLISLDGAYSFLDNENLLYVSNLLFTSVFCDLIATILTFVAFFFKLQKSNQVY